MPPVQFNSYAGGPHGLGPVVLPERKSVLGDIGSMLNEVGKVPGNMQQANLKYQLNNLLLQALTQPQTKSETIAGKEIAMNSPSGAGAGIDPLGLAEPGASYGSMMTEPSTRQVPNPEYEATTSRLEKIGPAFGMKFPTPIENIIAAGYAKSLGGAASEAEKQKGRIELERERQGGRTSLEEQRIGGRTDIEELKTEGRSTLLDRRIANQQKLKDKDIQARTDHDDTIREIAADKNLNEQQKLDKILKVKEKYNDDTIAVRKDFNNITRYTAESTADLRRAEEENKVVDNLINLRSQINLLTQQPQSQSQQTQLKGAIEQYNSLVDVANSNPNAPKIDYWKLDEPNTIRNWLKNFTGIGTPEQEIAPTPRPGGGVAPPRGTKPPGAPIPAPTSKPLEATPPGKPSPTGTFRPGEIPEEELKRRRDEIFGRSKGTK